MPHQSNLDALEASATSCLLYQLIWWAAGCSMVPAGGMVSFNPGVKYPSGRQIMTIMMERSYGSSTGMRALENGAFLFDTSAQSLTWANLYSWTRAPVSQKGLMFDHGYLETGTYKSPFKDGGFQLVGLGVRLGTGLSIEDALGNSTEEVNISGTYLRIRTDDGIELFHYTAWTAMWTSYLDSDMATIVPGRLRTDYQGSPMAFRRVKKWLEDCDKDHDYAKRHSCPEK